MESTNSLTILDGGMSRELMKLGAPFRQPEWSALSLLETPDKVYEVHKSFIDAGADVITTNAYALVPYHIGQDRFDEDGGALIKLSAKLACAAIKDSNKNVLVAGCIPPLFGSYLPDSFIACDAAKILKPLIEYQRDYVDLWLIETTASLKEALLVLEFLKERKKDIWLAFTLRDFENDGETPQLRSGEDLEDSLRKLKSSDILPSSLLFNCSQPEEMLPAIRIAQSIFPEIPTGAYANSFVRKQLKLTANKEVNKSREDLSPEAYLGFAQSWVDAGATIIGGCCGIGPDYIKLLKEKLYLNAKND